MNGDLPNRPLAAGACVLTGMAIIGLADSFVVGIAEIVGLWQFHMLRSAFIVPVLIVIALALGHPILPRQPFGVAVRSLALALSMLLYFGSLAVFSVAEAAAGLFTSPIFVLLMTALFLRHQVGPVRIAAVTVGFAGTVLVLGPADDGIGWLSVFPVAAGAAYAVNALATRTL
ncbi:MAG: EamA family transporter [Pseudomonadota bacterium]